MAVCAANQYVNDRADGSVTARGIHWLKSVGEVYAPYKSGKHLATAVLAGFTAMFGDRLNLPGYTSLEPALTYNETYVNMLDNASAVNYGHMFIGRNQDNYTTLFIGSGDHESLLTSMWQYRNSSGIAKRDYYIDWASYSYDDGQIFDADNMLQEVRYMDDIESADYAAGVWLNDHMGQKICIAGFSVDGTNSIDADTAEREFFCKGEVYWNAYGGVDGFCNSDDDGMGYWLLWKDEGCCGVGPTITFMSSRYTILTTTEL